MLMTCSGAPSPPWRPQCAQTSDSCLNLSGGYTLHGSTDELGPIGKGKHPEQFIEKASCWAKASSLLVISENTDEQAIHLEPTHSQAQTGQIARQ